MANWSFYVALQRSGEIVGELELESAEFTRQLLGGPFRAQVNLGGLPRYHQRDIVELTRPGKYSIIVDNGGRVFGEWLIWTRDRQYGSPFISIAGNEMLSHLDQRLIWTKRYSNVEQLQIAHDLANDGFRDDPSQGGGIAMSYRAFSPSGRTRVRNYEPVEASIGQRLKELSQVINGFDYDIATTWTSISGRRYVNREFVTYYPRKGQPQPFVFDLGDFGGNGYDLSVAEDAGNYASHSWAIGSENPDTGQVRGESRTGDIWIGQGYPFRQRAITRYSVKDQATIDSHAQAFQAVNQVAELPGRLSVLVDGFPTVMDYDTGDTVLVNADPSDSFPDGWGGMMRIQSITIQPNAEAGEYETAGLELAPANSVPGTQEDES